jgi:CHASE2 domain-containing sensor protein
MPDRDITIRLKARWKSCIYCTRLSQKGLRYWLSVTVIIAACTIGSGYVYDHLDLEGRRSELFQWLLENGPHPPEPKDVKIVLVEDDEYWEGDPAGRQPIKRTYLKTLVNHLVDAKAHVIGLDFDLRTSNPDSTAIPADYEQETLELIETIVASASRGTKFVLATPIFYDGQSYRQDADPYQAYGLCKPNDDRIPKESQISHELAQAIRANRHKNITCGYIYLPDDSLVIPSSIELNDKTELDSFALSVAKAGWFDLNSVRNLGSRIRYANFISESKLRNPKAPILFSASAVLEKGEKEDIHAVKTALGGRSIAVIVGGNWSTYAVGRGPPVDEHQTPVGPIPGAMLQANFVEAILDNRIFLFVPEGVLRSMEVFFSAIAAIVFALSQTTLRQIMNFALLCSALLITQWAALHGFALFFDAYVPLLGVALHSLSERLLGVHAAKNEKGAPRAVEPLSISDY